MPQQDKQSIKRTDKNEKASSRVVLANNRVQKLCANKMSANVNVWRQNEPIVTFAN